VNIEHPTSNIEPGFAQRLRRGKHRSEEFCSLMCFTLSKARKISRRFFQALEKFCRNFPILGKTTVSDFQSLEKYRRADFRPSMFGIGCSMFDVRLTSVFVEGNVS
jgi:hypothetical protein